MLIPRPETEELVEHVIAWASSRAEAASDNLRMLDVGCGSGAIGLALLRAGASSACTGLDVSAEACALATENAAALGLGDRFTTTMQVRAAAEITHPRRHVSTLRRHVAGRRELRAHASVRSSRE